MASRKQSKSFHQKKNYRKKKYKQTLGLAPEIVSSVKCALQEDDFVHIRKLVEGLDEYDLAKLIESLNWRMRGRFVKILGKAISAEVFPELNEVVQEQVIESLDEEQIVEIVNNLDSDDAVEILENLDDEEQKSIIDQLEPELKYQVVSSLNYPEDSAGRIMSREYVFLEDNMTVAQAKAYLLEAKNLPEEFYNICITDKHLHPTGQVSLDKLVVAKSNVKLADIMDCEIIPIDVETDQEEVANMFREYGWKSAMVVDNKCRLIGVINIDDIVDIIHEEATEDIMHMSGADEGDVYKSPVAIFKSRVWWLITNLVATIVAAFVVSGFQDVIAQVSVLAVLMPIVASMSGTTGNQTLAVVVRALATKEITSANTFRMILKEFLVGIMNGALFAGLIALVVYFWFPDKLMISYIIAVAMALTLIIASLSGILIPLTLNKFKIDPAISSGVFLIAITDSFGFFIFLGLAKLLLFK